MLGVPLDQLVSLEEKVCFSIRHFPILLDCTVLHDCATILRAPCNIRRKKGGEKKETK